MPLNQNIIILFTINFFAGLVFFKLPILANFYSLYILFFGLVFSLSKKINLSIYYLLFLSSYGIVLRVLRVGTFYEFDKYAVIVLSISILFTCGNNILKSSKKYILFFILIIPGMVLPGMSYDNMSLYMSGPIALIISAILFSDLDYTLDLKKCFYSLLSPIIILSSILCIHLITNIDTLEFRHSTVENKITSGGFGPNQVSTVLGFGMVICTILFFIESKKITKIILILFWVFFSFQAALSFSRGGLYGGLLGTIILVLFNFDKKFIVGLSFLFVITIVSFKVIFSNEKIIAADQGLALIDRVTRLTTTGRVDMMIQDINIFFENPLLGVGLGQSSEYHIKNIYGKITGSHTFYTRLLAEHGIFGLMCMLILLSTALKSLVYHDPNQHKSITISILSWSAFTMMHNDVRLGLTAVMFSFCEYLINEKKH